MTMKNIAIKIITVMMVLTVMTPFMAGVAFAATNVTITGDDEVSKGSEFTVHIEFSGDNAAKVEGQIGFDSSKLEYVSGGEDGGEGYVILKKGGGEGSVAFDITFKAIKGGNTGIDVSSSKITDVNKNDLENCAVTKVISISGDSENTDENVVQEEKAPQPTEEDLNPGIGNSKVFIVGGIVLAAIIIVVIVIVVRRRKKDK